MLRIPLADMQLQFNRVLQRQGFDPNAAERCAQIFAENSLVGVASHGLNRFPGFVEFVRRGFVKPNARPTLAQNLGAWEQWDGNLGPGPLNAYAATERAMELARQHGVGCVGLRNTNHWMRGGYYGWMAAEAGLALISWTNTKPNMPPWGAIDSHVGNNPLVLAVPKPNGPVVLDMAMSQYSMGRMEGAARAGETLPLPGGFDVQGNLSTDPGAILAADRALPIGYWKGSGLALLLDLVAALLAGGLTTHEIGQQETEYGVSQVFIAFDVTRAGGAALVHRAVDEAIADLHRAVPVAEGDVVLYPGERALRTRAENLDKGIPVEPAIWQRVLEM
ncbi:MAG: 3-dehydro-L-gulonate 2-dehydrogenase [Caldilineaceae bacterium]|nr:3-dehydro-L-gulonate 2-dehydrogenase [Caldilineaceae bacterium]MCB0095454.1 3-dehydro-L-gulonate 2-dehydrogenase [Caldilineaceae bacterium]MCB0141605.1 3-dehydro-L-gulonate 2-dehydrogenase [Caldilineaceae bacterium]